MLRVNRGFTRAMIAGVGLILTSRAHAEIQLQIVDPDHNGVAAIVEDTQFSPTFAKNTPVIGTDTVQSTALLNRGDDPSPSHTFSFNCFTLDGIQTIASTYSLNTGLFSIPFQIIGTAGETGPVALDIENDFRFETTDYPPPALLPLAFYSLNGGPIVSISDGDTTQEYAANVSDTFLYGVQLTANTGAPPLGAEIDASLDSTLSVHGVDSPGPSPAPEPESLALLATGGLPLFSLWRRRRTIAA